MGFFKWFFKPPQGVRVEKIGKRTDYRDDRGRPLHRK